MKLDQWQKTAILGIVQKMLDERYVRILNSGHPLPYAMTRIVSISEVGEIMMKNFIHDLSDEIEKIP